MEQTAKLTERKTVAMKAEGFGEGAWVKWVGVGGRSGWAAAHGGAVAPRAPAAQAHSVPVSGQPGPAAGARPPPQAAAGGGPSA